jgi:tetratricopeptide (TPR) repeat protein
LRHLLAAALLAGCSAPLPVPPTAPPVQALAPSQPAAAPAAPEPAAATPSATSGPSEALQKQFAQAVVAMQGAQDQAATALFADIAKQDPQLASPHTNLGILFYREGRLAEAEAAFKDALQRDPKDYVAANYLGMIYRGSGRFSEAEAAYQQALAAKPDYGYAHLNIAILYDLYLGDLAKALDHYQQYQQLGGDSDPQLAGWLADLQQRMKSAGEITKP